MRLNINPQKPIFICISEWLEDAIIGGIFNEESQVPSSTEISIEYNINPATSLKGVNLLVESGILYKKRGLGMFVAAGAREKLIEQRRHRFFDEFIKPLIREAERLGISVSDLKTMIEGEY